MSNMYDRILLLCEKKGIKPGRVCADTGLSRGMLSDLKMGRTKELSAKNTKIIADYFGVSSDFLLGIRSEKTPTPEGGRDSGVVRIPVLGAVPAGIPIEAIEDILDWEEIPAQQCAGGKEFFALQVEGDSMWPDYLPGDVVIVRKTPVCDTGDICVVYVNGYDATLKEVKLLEDGSVTLVPHNQNYPPRTFSTQEVQELPVSIAGVVEELRRKIKRRK